MDRRVRLLSATVLLAATLGLCVHYGATYETGWPYSTGEQLTTDYANHVGGVALLAGLLAFLFAERRRAFTVLAAGGSHISCSTR
ncbi:hypothetical protein [Halalkalicoccus ordinarius]|uniref:hypothetical protein n=1 Tax=Halalkalicoccus ordinarius TaxID=3116651 RepID=UPI00300F496E